MSSTSSESYYRPPPPPTPSTYSHHHQSSFKLPPIRTLGLAPPHEPSLPPSGSPAGTMPPPQSIPRDSWTRSSLIRPLTSDGPPPPPDSPFASNYSNSRDRRTSTYNDHSPSTTHYPLSNGTMESAHQQQPTAEEGGPSMAPSYPSSVAPSSKRRAASPPPPSRSSYSRTGGEHPHPHAGSQSQSGYQSAQQTQPPEPPTPTTHHYGPPPPPVDSRSSGPLYGQQPPYTPAQPPTQAYAAPAQSSPMPPPPTSTALPPLGPPPASHAEASGSGMYGQRPPPPPPPMYGGSAPAYSHAPPPPPMGYNEWGPPPPQAPYNYPPPTNGHYPSQQYSSYGPPPPPPPQYAQGYPSQPPHMSGPPPLEWSTPMMPQAQPPMPPTPQPGPSNNVGTAAPPDKPIAQILEHCQRIMAFANYYAGFQPPAPSAPQRPSKPSLQETKEMANRAETIVQLLLKLADESRPIRKALEPPSTPGPSSTAPGRSATPSIAAASSEKKKRKAEDEENADPNDEDQEEEGDEGEKDNDKEGDEWGMSKDQKARLFGSNQEAYELAEKDMRTITAKRTASQGGMLPQQKTKYKKRSRATPPGRCHSCFSTETPEWRRGPDGARTLCNACGLHFAKLAKRSPQTYITIPMLQASAHKNGIGANGIVPALPGAVNGTVGGVRASVAAKKGPGDTAPDVEEDEDEVLPTELEHEGPPVVSSLAETVSVREARRDARTKGKQPAVAAGKGKDRMESDELEEESDAERPNKKQKRQELPAQAQQASTPTPAPAPALQQRPPGGGWGRQPSPPVAPTSKPYPLTPVTSGGEENRSAAPGPSRNVWGGAPRPAQPHDAASSSSAPTKRFLPVAPPGWGGPHPQAVGPAAGDQEEEDEDEEDEDGGEDSAVGRLRESSNMRSDR